MKSQRGFQALIALGLGALVIQSAGLAMSPQAAAQASTPVRPIGVVTEIQPGSLTLRTDAGPSLVILLPEGVSAVRVPPGAKDLKAATKITPAEIRIGDRVIARGHASADHQALVASSLIVMSEADLTKAHETERLEWRAHSIGGVVKAIDPATRVIALSVPNVPPAPGTPAPPVLVTVPVNATLLRYAPDSVKFSDAKPGTFDQIKVGDQVRALGTKSADGSHFAAEKIVSGTFRNIGATVVSVDVQAGTVTLKDLATGQLVLVRTNADTRLHTLPPYLAQMLARWNARGTSEEAAQVKAESNSPGGGDIQQMLEHTPPLTLSELKPGEPLIVVSTEGARPSEVTAIVVLAGVEPILASQPKGSKEMALKEWTLGMGGGGETTGGP